MIRHVVDASVAIKWFVDEVHAESARHLLADEYALSAPDLLWPECGNILWKKVQREELTAPEARLIREGLAQQPFHISPSSLLFEPALEIAFDTGRTVYDSCYVALAMLMQYPLVTADQRLFNALQMTDYAPHLVWVADLPDALSNSVTSC
jgi:predicted nucleic acid-binding protein